MELSLKSKSIKKRHKKRKITVSEDEVAPIIKPDAIDGVCNWVKMQKLFGPVKEEKEKKETVKSTPNPETIGQKSKGFHHKAKNSSHDSGAKQVHNASRNGWTSNCDKKPINGESHRKSEDLETNKKSQCQPYKFHFAENKETFSNETKNSTTEEETDKYSDKRLTKAVAMDCEMVGTGPTGEDSVIARVSIVNSFGVCLYDEFVKPRERVTDFRTKISGVRPSDLKNGKDLFEVQKEVSSILEGRILVGHSVKHDLDVLFLSHPRHLIRDTAFYKPFRELSGGRTPSLKKLTSEILGCDIQAGEHSSVEDAQAAMLLYLRMKKEWEKEMKSRRKRKPKNIENHPRD